MSVKFPYGRSGVIGVPSLMFDTLETLSEALYRIGNGSFGIGDNDALTLKRCSDKGWVGSVWDRAQALWH